MECLRILSQIRQRGAFLTRFIEEAMKRAMEDLISVIIPVYNIEGYIEHCLSSVVNQTYENLEIIIVDGSTSDDSSRICKSFAEKDSRIVYIRQNKKGVVDARKTGVINAKGKYITFVDGDDYAEKCLVEKLYQYMLQYDVDFVHSDYMIDGKNINLVKQYHYYTENDLTFSARADILKNYVFEWDNKNEIIECNLYGCIFKNEFITQCVCMLSDNQQYGEDLICMCHQIMKCKSMLLVPEAYYHYVIRDGSATHGLKIEDLLLNEISLYKEIERVLLEYSVPNATLDKCHEFSARKMFGFLMLNFGWNTKTEYVCDYLDKLFDKRIIIYGAGNVGKCIYEQLTSYESIKIVGWVDRNFREIHSDYRTIYAPNVIQSLDYDYIVIAVESEDIVRQIEKNLIESNVKKEDILWRPYKKINSISI
jgi:glycosyltransferase involved in cell wall biosynthesis